MEFRRNSRFAKEGDTRQLIQNVGFRWNLEYAFYVPGFVKLHRFYLGNFGEANVRSSDLKVLFSNGVPPC